jgi:hypothetical protein
MVEGKEISDGGYVAAHAYLTGLRWYEIAFDFTSSSISTDCMWNCGVVGGRHIKYDGMHAEEHTSGYGPAAFRHDKHNNRLDENTVSI